MDKQNFKKNKNIIPKKSNQNNTSKITKKTIPHETRPLTGFKPIDKTKINLTKKSNTPKKIFVINLNEEISQKRPVKQNMDLLQKNNAKKQIHKKSLNEGNYSNIKKNNTNNANNINNINTNAKITQNLSLIDQISNLTSLYNALSYINLKLDSTFVSQKEEAENDLNNKYSEAIDLKEKNFKLFQQINSMSNIIDIDDYFLNYYTKIMELYPKISNIVENINDFVSNVNYGIDRINLVDDLLCDENLLEKNISKTKDELLIMNKNLDNKKDEIYGNKSKYEELYNRLKIQEKEIHDIENKLDNFKQNVLVNNIDSIYSKLVNKNKQLLNDILND